VETFSLFLRSLSNFVKHSIFFFRTYAGKGRAKRCRLKLEGRILAKKDEL
jgi:hypothetical protein